MLRTSTVIVSVTLLFGVWAMAQEEAAPTEPKVNLTAQETPVAEVAAEVTAQTGVQVAITDNTDKDLTGALEDKTVEEAVKLLAAGAHASWLRVYMLETAPPEEPYTAAELLQMVSEARDSFWEGMDEEQRRALYETWRARLTPEGEEPPQPAGGPEGGQGEGDGRGRMDGRGMGMGGFGMGGVDMPGGGIIRMQAPEGAEQPAEGGRGGMGWMMNYDDPFRSLLMPARFDTITMSATDMPLADALWQFTAETGFLVFAPEDLDGAVTLQLEEAPLSEALTAMAAAVGAQWRPVYIMGQPREFTAEELAARGEQWAQRRDARFRQMWDEYWQMPAQERTAQLQERIARYENIPPERMERAQRRAARRLPRMMEYVGSLPTEQRLELKPYLQAIARVAGQ